MQAATDRFEPPKSATRGCPQAARRPVGTPLRSATRPRASYGTEPPPERTQPSPPRAIVTPTDARTAQKEFFLDHLAAVPNKRGTPYSAHTIAAYRDAVISLGRYLTGIGFAGGFEDVDVSTLNGFLVQYRADNSQGGTVTKQGNLRVFFAWLVEEYEAQEVFNHPKRHRYAREDEPAAILGDEFIADLMKVTSGKSFLEVRDQAIIRTLLLGPRRAEVAGLYVEDLDMRSAIKTVTTGRMKGNAGRAIPLPPGTVVAMNRWLRTRAAAKSRPAANQGPLWIAAKGVVVSAMPGSTGCSARAHLVLGRHRHLGLRDTGRAPRRGGRANARLVPADGRRHASEPPAPVGCREDARIALV
jgi:site-specific recombinase XerC